MLTAYNAMKSGWQVDGFKRTSIDGRPVVVMLCTDPDRHVASVGTSYAEVLLPHALRSADRRVLGLSIEIAHWLLENACIYTVDEITRELRTRERARTEEMWKARKLQA